MHTEAAGDLRFPVSDTLKGHEYPVSGLGRCSIAEGKEAEVHATAAEKGFSL